MQSERRPPNMWGELFCILEISVAPDTRTGRTDDATVSCAWHRAAGGRFTQKHTHDTGKVIYC